ncbi:phosphatase [Clostridium cylindrosporum]|uniref:Putative phosphatase n=1 Tax=Clostridium cylindrosporum DSM 605 TaxID=1121307 RepID=A0A0J8DBH7_CLOCY|nr:phosphatase [Clostridium cylindrosporum]KMT23197.1 putative phosphatase [Clostridium cylindrosporum DSM 605]
MKAILDVHVHTISSGHAYSTIKENIDEAAKKGIKILGISDHAPTMPGSSDIIHFQNLRVLKETINGVRILKGIEANIIDFEGNIDVSDNVLEELDYAIASIHPPCIKVGECEENTNSLIKAMENPYIKIIGHPDDNRVPINYEALVKAAKDNGVLLEVNNSSLNPNAHRVGARENVKTMLRLCKEHEVMIILGSDSHIYYDVGEFANCIDVLEEADFPSKLVLNFTENPLEILGIK